MGHKNKEGTGYLSFEYAQSFAEFAKPRFLPHCGGTILERMIPGTSHRDAMGPYPLFCCSDLRKLESDLLEAESRLISFSAVLDPFAECDEEFLRNLFPDKVLRFKEHFVTDLSQAPASFVSQHHQRNAIKAREAVRVEASETPLEFLEEWLVLYAGLVKRHSIGDLRSFSRCAFEHQLKVPGVRAFVAYRDRRIIGMLIWYVQGPIAYYHLGAYSEEGYALGASFALFSAAIEFFRQSDALWLCLGAGAGTTVDGNDGLARFKQGWSTGTRPVFFCGRILNRDVYAEIARSQGRGPTDYFPAYRQGEFCKKTSK